MNIYQLFKPNKKFYHLVRVVVPLVTASELNNCVQKILVWSLHFLIGNAKLKYKLLNEYFSFLNVSKEIYFSDFFEPPVGRQIYKCTIRHSSWSIVVDPFSKKSHVAIGTARLACQRKSRTARIFHGFTKINLPLKLNIQK